MYPFNYETISNKEDDAWVAYVLDHGVHRQGEIAKAFRRLDSQPELKEKARYHSSIFVSKKTCLALQAADILAYQL